MYELCVCVCVCVRDSFNIYESFIDYDSGNVVIMVFKFLKFMGWVEKLWILFFVGVYFV